MIYHTHKHTENGSALDDRVSYNLNMNKQVNNLSLNLNKIEHGAIDTPIET